MSLVEDLQRTLTEQPGSVAFIVGAGVAVGALRGGAHAELASWTGLLRSGLRRVRDIDAISDGELTHFDRQLGFSSPTALLGVADVVVRGLSGPQGGEFRRWLRETVGAFTRDVSDRSVLDVLAEHQRRGASILTTNYDELLEAATGLRAATWRDSTAVERTLHGLEPRILHLHGVWDQPESVVLGTASYEDVLRDEHAQTMLAALRTMRTFVFVGCGAGLQDPNIGGFLHWTAKVFASSEFRHFRLSLSTEQEALRREHPPAQRIFPLVYGDSHAALAPFLRGLLPPVPATPSATDSTSHAPAIAAYCRALLERLAPMRAIWARPSVSSEVLESLFVEPRLAPQQRPRAPGANDGGAIAPDTAPEVWQRRLPEPGRPGVLVLGELGAGKSTALRVAARRLCRGGVGLPEHLADKVPVWVELADFASKISQDHADTALLRYVEASETHLPASVLWALDAAGQLVWVLDGLDEVIEEPVRSSVIAAIDALVAGDSPRLVLVSSRIQPTPLLSPRFERLELAPWDDGRITALARCYYEVIQPASDAEARAGRVLASLRTNVALYELCQWPLFLGLVLSLGHAGEVPWPRHRLYRKALDLILDEWDAVSVAPVRLSSDDKLAFVRRVAWAMLQRGRLALARADVVALAVEFFAGLDEPRESARMLALAMVDDLSRRGSILAPTGDSGLAFSHRAWMDYAAARELHGRREADHEVFAARWSDPVWSGALLVAVGLLAEDDPAAVPPLLHTVLRSVSSFAMLFLVKPLAFVVRALGYCVHLRREPIIIFAKTLTAWMIEIGIDSIWTLDVAPALRESGPNWPGADALRTVATSQLGGRFALSACGMEHRCDVIIRCLERAPDMDLLNSLLREGRRIGAWRSEELRRLLAVDVTKRSEVSPLFVAAGLLAHEALSEVLTFVRVRLRASDPEIRAYAALALLYSERADTDVLDVLGSAMGEDAWQSNATGLCRPWLSRMVEKITKSLPEPDKTRFRQVVRASGVRGLYASLSSGSPVTNQPETSPNGWIDIQDLTDVDVLTRHVLGMSKKSPLSNDVLAAHFRALEPIEALSCLYSVITLHLAPDFWRKLAIELYERCTEAEQLLDLAILLGDHRMLQRLASVNGSTGDHARDALRQAEALNAVLRVAAAPGRGVSVRV